MIHVQLVAALAIWAFRTAPRAADLARAADASDGVAVTALDDETARQIAKELDRQEEQQRQEEERKQRESLTPPGQVVELPRPREERRPDHARFAAEHDSTVEKESQRRAREDDQPRESAPAPSAPAATPSAPPAPPPRPSLLAMRSPGEGPGASPEPARPPSDLGGQGPQTESGPQHQDLPAPATGGGGPPSPPTSTPQPAPEAPPGMDRLLSNRSIARAMSTTGTHDFLRDVDEGEDTALNARSWKYASFFNRVKDQVRQYWKPAAEYRQRDPDGTIYGEHSRLTMCWVVLKRDGALAEVKLDQASGLEFLDDVAVEAIKLASPFPNPPPELVDETGTIRFKFGFYFEIGTAPKMRVFRYSGL